MAFEALTSAVLGALRGGDAPALIGPITPDETIEVSPGDIRIIPRGSTTSFPLRQDFASTDRWGTPFQPIFGASTPEASATSMLPLAAAGALGPLTGQTKPPLTGSAKIAFDALNPPLRSDTATRIPRRTIPSLRPSGLPSFLGKGGLLGLALASGLWPSQISKEQGIVPESGALTPEQLFKQRNDAEEARLRSVEEPGLWDRTKGLFGGLLRQDPNIPEEPIWDPQALSLIHI